MLPVLLEQPNKQGDVPFFHLSFLSCAGRETEGVRNRAEGWDQDIRNRKSVDKNP
jgi:hypothetical protein